MGRWGVRCLLPGAGRTDRRPAAGQRGRVRRKEGGRSSAQTARWTLPALMHLVHTRARRAVPLILMRTACRLGFHVRRVLRLEWLTAFPVPVCLLQMTQALATLIPSPQRKIVPHCTMRPLRSQGGGCTLPAVLVICGKNAWMKGLPSAPVSPPPLVRGFPGRLGAHRRRGAA